jgi:hypothetical protein
MQHYLESQNITLKGVLVYAVVAIVIYFGLPRMLRLFVKPKIERQKILLLASIMLFLSVLLPSPLIHGQNTNFVTHFVGGGLFTGFIWLYLKNYVGWNGNWLAELTTLYFLVCGLGVANELMEFALNGAGIIHIPSNDTWWDLFANTLGAFSFWIIYRLSSQRR